MRDDDRPIPIVPVRDDDLATRFVSIAAGLERTKARLLRMKEDVERDVQAHRPRDAQ